MEQVQVFGKEEIARRLQLPLERVEVLIQEHGMPNEDEEAYIDWVVSEDHTNLVMEELKKFGPVAQMEATSAKTSQIAPRHDVSAPASYDN